MEITLIQVYSTEELVGISKGHIVRTMQNFTQIWRGKISPTTKDFTKICQRLLSAIYFKLRRLKPCLISNLSMKAEMDDENELQLTFSGMYNLLPTFSYQTFSDLKFTECRYSAQRSLSKFGAPHRHCSGYFVL